MYLIAGLGNPGAQYAHTRHNAGFDAIDQLGEQANARYWKTEHGALTAKVHLGGEEVLLAKPQGFMNTSGGPIKHLMSAYGIDADHLIVIHDEMDLEPATVRIKYGGGLAGHNGLKSIAEKLGTRDWYRIRVGIGKPPGRMQGADYVLTPLKGQAGEDFAYGVGLAADAAPYLIENGLEKTQQRFN